MVSRIRSHLHILPPQLHHLSLINANTKQLPMGVEIPEYVCPLEINSSQPTLQSTKQTVPCIALTSGEGDRYVFDEVITDPAICEAMKSEYIFESPMPPDPLESLDAIAHGIALKAHSGVSQLVVSAGPVGSGHGTIAFTCPQSSVSIDRLSVSAMYAEQRRSAYLYHSSRDISQIADTSHLTASQMDDELRKLQLLQQVKAEVAAREAESLRYGLKRASRGLLWMIFKHVAPIVSAEDNEWPKMASFTLSGTHQITDLLNYPGITEAFGMADHYEVQSTDYTDFLDKPVEYQMYFEKLSDRAQVFEGTAFSNAQDAASAFLKSGILQPAAKDLSMPYRKAVSMSQSSNQVRARQTTSEDFINPSTVSAGSERAARPDSKTLHIQSLYSDVHSNDFGFTSANADQFSATTNNTSKRSKCVATISAKAFAAGLSQPSVLSLRTDNGLITPEYLAKSGILILNVNPCSLSLLKRSLLDRRRPICTWTELETVIDNTAPCKGNAPELPCLLSIRRQKGMPNYSLALDACAPTVTIIYLGPSRGYSTIVFVDMCTCTTQTPLHRFTLRPQFRTSLDSLSALKMIVELLSADKGTPQQGRSYLLARIILGHVPNLTMDLKGIEKAMKQALHRQEQMAVLKETILAKRNATNTLRELEKCGRRYSSTDKTCSESDDMSALMSKDLQSCGPQKCRHGGITGTENALTAAMLRDDTSQLLSVKPRGERNDTMPFAVGPNFSDVTILHSVQICESDSKNTLQQLRLAASLDRKVELGFYWSKQLYNDAMNLARIELVAQEAHDGYDLDGADLGLAYGRGHSDIEEMAEFLRCSGKYVFQDSGIPEGRVALDESSPVMSDVLNSTLTPSRISRRPENPSKPVERIYIGTTLNMPGHVTTMNTSLLRGGAQTEFSPLPSEAPDAFVDLTPRRISPHQSSHSSSPRTNGADSVIRGGSSILPSPPTLAAPFLAVDVGTGPSSAMERLHSCILRAETMMAALEEQMRLSGACQGRKIC